MYIVTGGAGFIGSAFVSKLNQEGVSEVLIVDNLNHSEKWKNLIGLSYLDYLHKDSFLELLAKGRFKAKITAIIHLGACSSTTETDSDYLMENNFHYSKALGKYSLENNTRFIYASSAATYGNGALGYSDENDAFPKLVPLNRYGYSKHLMDLWCLRKGYDKEFAAFKFFNVYGPNEYHKGDMRSVVHKAYQQIKANGSVKLFKSYHPDYTDGEQKRDFIYVKDCCDVMWWFLENPDTNGIFNLGTGQARSWNELAKAAFAALSLEPKIEYIDMPEELKSHYQYFTEANMDKLLSSGCPFKPHSLEDGVKDYIQNHLEA